MKNWKGIAALMLCAGFAQAQGIHLTGTVKDMGGTALMDAVVTLKTGLQVLPLMRTLSDAQGAFALDSGAGGITHALPGKVRLPGALAWESASPGKVRVEALALDGRLVAAQELQVGAGTQRLSHAGSLLQGQPMGVYLVRVRLGNQTLAVGKLASNGQVAEPVGIASGSGSGSLPRLASAQWLVVRKAGYVPDTIDLSSTNQALGTITLQRDPIEAKIDSIIAVLTLAEKIGQMTQADLANVGTSSLSSYKLGSVLSGGDEGIPNYDTWQTVAMANPHPIPFIYGVDAVHGNNKVAGAVVFPHNVGLGATRDTNLVRRVAEVTAKEVLASGVEWTFAPCIAVPRDERWGRTYEGFGETPELSTMMADAYVRGLQGDRFDAPWRVIATAKHFLADGGTAYGTSNAGGYLDQGNTLQPDSVIRQIHLPGYAAAVEANVLTVMASFSSINGVKMHASSTWLTDVLKGELGFEGFVISDWNAINQLNGNFTLAVKAAVNAGVDLAMQAGNMGSGDHAAFITSLTSLVNTGDVSQARIDDAVRRILRVKYRAGRFDHPMRSHVYDAEFGGSEHRAIAREAVRKSLVVLKNDNAALPLAKVGKKIYVLGSNANDAGSQCGGWTLSWQGQTGAITGATTILQGLQAVTGTSTVATASQYALPTDADEFVVVIGETPYAEFMGDRTDLTISASDQSLIAAVKAKGKPVVVVVVSGRPLVIPPATLANVDALVAAWLPGSEGAGVADILFGDYAPTGKLPHSWPRTMAQIPINVGDASYDPLFPYGAGLTW